MATLLALGSIGLLRWFEARRISGLVLSLGLLWLGFGIVMSQSRTGWLMVAVIGAWYAFQSMRLQLRLRPAAVAAGVAVFTVGVIAWWPINDLLLLSADAWTERVAPGTRLIHWQTLWDALWRSPWTGYGWTQVNIAQRAAAEAHPSTGEVIFYSHNLLLDLLVWNGVPIGAVLIAGLATWYVKTIRAVRGPEECALFAGITAVLIHAMLEYPVSYAYFLLPLGLMMGALDARVRAGVDATPGGRRAFSGLYVALTGMLIIVGREYFIVEEDARTARLVAAGIGVDKVSVVTVPDVWVLDSLREHIRFIGTPVTTHMSNEQLDSMRKVSERYTYADILYRYAMAAALNGRQNEARGVLITICNLHIKQRCDEGREGWAELGERFPQAEAVSYPSGPNIPWDVVGRAASGSR
jgi:hypothetical protein